MSLFLFHITHSIFDAKVNDKCLIIEQIRDYFGISEHFETSYGSHKTRICNYPTFNIESAYDFEFDCNPNKLRNGIWFRVAVGYESNLEMNLTLLKSFVYGLQKLFCETH